MNNNNELSDFLKIAYKYNKVINIEEAFEEYPVEEEWHKGKIENVLKEKRESYNIYNIGDIVFVSKYLYKDEQILFKIGKVDKTKIEEYKEAFLKSINNSN